MKKMKAYSLVFCTMAIFAMQNATTQAGGLLGNVFSNDCTDCCVEGYCCDDGCCDEAPRRWWSGFSLFNNNSDCCCVDDCCIDDCCTDDYCVDGCCDYREEKLFGFIRRSNCGFDDFISPMTNPMFFEDPRNLSEIRPIYMNQRIPRGVLGGTVHLFAPQIRASITENLSIVASRAGFAVSSNPLVLDGWADVTAGLKYNILQDAERGRLLSAGFAYTLPVGSTRTLQARGDGQFHLYMAGAKRIGCKAHYMTNAGFYLPVNAAANSKMFYWSNHLDYEVAKRVYLFTETNWFNWFQGGNNPALPTIEGGDLINLGSNDVAGNNIVTSALGLKLKVAERSEFGVAYEIPVTSRNDIMDNRFTADYIIRY